MSTMNPVACSESNDWAFTILDPDTAAGIYIWTNAPSAGGDDIAQLTYGATDVDNANPGNTDYEFTYIAFDRCAQGQTFTTGSSNTYELTSF